MFKGKKKMKGERKINDNFHGETSNNHHKQQMFEGVSSASSCCYDTNGFCFSDVVVGSSSSTSSSSSLSPSSSSMPPFDHTRFPTPKTHFVDQIFVPDSCYKRGNNSGVFVDELGLAREFQNLDVGENFGQFHGEFHGDPDVFRVPDCNVGEIRGSLSDNFGVLGGFCNGVSANGGGFSSHVYRDDKGFKDDRGYRLGQRGGHFGDSFGSNLPYALHDHNNLINFPLEGTTPYVGNDCYGNGVALPKGNKYYDRVPVYGSDDFMGNVSIPRGNESFGNGGVIPRGDLGYGNEIPYQVESTYGPRVVGEALPPYMMDGYKEMLSSWANSQMYKHSLDEAFSEQYGWQFPGNLSGLNTMGNSQMLYPKQASSRENVLYNSVRERMRIVEEREVSSPVTLRRRTRHLDPYGGEKTLIIPEKGLNGGIGRNHPLSGRTKNFLSANILNNIEERSFEFNAPLQTEVGCDNGNRAISDPLVLQTLYNSLVEVRGNIYLMAKDQHGCRFLQKKFDEGSLEDVQLIFSEIIDHVVELMMNPFGNYLIQKLLDVCNEDQRMKIVHVVTKDRGELVRISLNTHGTRVVQKLIESLTTRKQISLIIRALEPGFLDLIKDLNGNHVVQRCLQCLSSDDNKFIFDAAAKYCVEIATHRHGCCVLQRCIGHSTGEHRQKLIEQICSHGLVLAQDPFGNYVVQYIIELKIPSASALLISQFQGNYVHLSTQKFSSHVVEKCLKCIEDSRPQIVYELLSVSHFEQLVQDPYANYVLQSALEYTKGTLYESLVTAVRPHSILRTNPYCKKIFSRVKK